MELLEMAARVVPPSPCRVSGWLRLAVVPVVVAVVVAGVWVTGGLLTNDEVVAKGATVAWFGLAGCLAAASALRWRRLAVPVLASFLVAAVSAGGFLLWSSSVDRVVNEDVVTAAPTVPPVESGGDARPVPPAAAAGATLLGEGRFRSGEHTTTGVARLLQRPGGEQVVTLTALSTSPGPDLRVYLARGDGSSVAGAADLGRLKGNKGNQQYRVPTGVDARRYGAVVVWCRAFSVPFGVATLATVG
jgi:hypothetical protein